jgi:hypothetical protein
MRNRWDHEAPEDHQPTPRDNTSRYVSAQVSRWLRTDEPVHPEVAMEIAAWWVTPSECGTSLRRFAQTGMVTIAGINDDHGYDDLAGAIQWILGQRGHVASDLLPVRALQAYVDHVVKHATRYREHIWYGGSHRWMSTDTTDRDSCLTCGVLAELRPEPDSDGAYGCYYGGDGESIIACTGRTDLVHGYPGERNCEADMGRGCEASIDTGECTHTDHECNCLFCK